MRAAQDWLDRIQDRLPNSKRDLVVAIIAALILEPANARPLIPLD